MMFDTRWVYFWQGFLLGKNPVHSHEEQAPMPCLVLTKHILYVNEKAAIWNMHSAIQPMRKTLTIEYSLSYDDTEANPVRVESLPSIYYLAHILIHYLLFSDGENKPM